MFLIPDWINRKWILVQVWKSRLGFGFKQTNTNKQTKNPQSPTSFLSLNSLIPVLA